MYVCMVWYDMIGEGRTTDNRRSIKHNRVWCFPYHNHNTQHKKQEWENQRFFRMSPNYTWFDTNSVWHVTLQIYTNYVNFLEFWIPLTFLHGNEIITRTDNENTEYVGGARPLRAKDCCEATTTSMFGVMRNLDGNQHPPPHLWFWSY